MTDRPVMQRDHENARMAVVGRLTGGGGQCTIVAVHYRSPRHSPSLPGTCP
ncbi:MAG: hypothetical protein LC808_22400 [Actinobacteria bacterium]|nr:hypothetical protein [Actinomycetota bacterium]